jgi:menaquinol-cytochrome c reductase iron-sulfur subunit
MAEDRSKDISRRGFLGLLAGTLAFVGVALNAIPFVGVLLAQVQAGGKGAFIAAGPTSSLKTGVPVSLTFADVEQDAYLRQSVVRSVWAVKKASGDIVVYTPVCPHLGCQYSWDTATARFICPCHTSIWTIDGKLISGPSPRDLDALPSKVQGGVLFVRWERYKLATPQKITVA